MLYLVREGKDKLKHYRIRSSLSPSFTLHVVSIPSEHFPRNISAIQRGPMTAQSSRLSNNHLKSQYDWEPSAVNQIWSAVLCTSLQSCRQLTCLLVVIFLWLADATMTDQCLQGTGWCSSVIPVSHICPLKKLEPE